MGVRSSARARGGGGTEERWSSETRSQRQRSGAGLLNREIRPGRRARGGERSDAGEDGTWHVERGEKDEMAAVNGERRRAADRGRTGRFDVAAENSLERAERQRSQQRRSGPRDDGRDDGRRGGRGETAGTAGMGRAARCLAQRERANPPAAPRSRLRPRRCFEAETRRRKGEERKGSIGNCQRSGADTETERVWKDAGKSGERRERRGEQTERLIERVRKAGGLLRRGIGDQRSP